MTENTCRCLWCKHEWMRKIPTRRPKRCPECEEPNWDLRLGALRAWKTKEIRTATDVIDAAMRVIGGVPALTDDADAARRWLEADAIVRGISWAGTYGIAKARISRQDRAENEDWVNARL